MILFSKSCGKVMCTYRQDRSNLTAEPLAIEIEVLGYILSSLMQLLPTIRNIIIDLNDNVGCGIDF